MPFVVSWKFDNYIPPAVSMANARISAWLNVEDRSNNLSLLRCQLRIKRYRTCDWFLHVRGIVIGRLRQELLPARLDIVEFRFIVVDF